MISILVTVSSFNDVSFLVSIYPINAPFYSKVFSDSKSHAIIFCPDKWEDEIRPIGL